MTSLVEVTAAWLRSFGYATRRDATPDAETGAVHAVPLLAERDARRIGLYFSLQREPPTETLLGRIRAALHDRLVDEACLLTLAPLGEAFRKTVAAHGIRLWDSERLVREFGEAVLYETNPDVLSRADPLLASTRPTATAPPPPDPTHELPFPSDAAPVLAEPSAQPAAELQVPLPFAMFDAAPTPAAAAPPVEAPAPAPPARPVLRSHVSKALAFSLVKKKLGTADRIFLRLVPYHVFDYEANLLVEGSLDAQSKKGRLAVDAAVKRVIDWTHPLDLGEPNPEGAEVDEKKVRVTEDDARKALRPELEKLVTRDVVLEEDADEWSVVVKKKVTLGPDDVRVEALGTYWLPVWRVSGKRGAVEIDAASGAVLFEEVLTEQSGAQLL